MLAGLLLVARGQINRAQATERCRLAVTISHLTVDGQGLLTMAAGPLVAPLLTEQDSEVAQSDSLTSEIAQLMVAVQRLLVQAARFLQRALPMSQETQAVEDTGLGGSVTYLALDHKRLLIAVSGLGHVSLVIGQTSQPGEVCALVYAVATAAGVAPSTLVRLEAGTCRPRARTQRRIAKALGVVPIAIAWRATPTPPRASQTVPMVKVERRPPLQFGGG